VWNLNLSHSKMLRGICILLLGFLIAAWEVGAESEKIVGGVAASIPEFPYQVSLFYNDRFICGGAIIGPMQILTAAHCIASPPTASAWSVRAGSASLTASSPTTQVRRAASVILHPEFGGVTFLNDIAVITLGDPLIFGEGVQPLALSPAGKEPYASKPLVATGWGATGTGGFAIDALMQVRVPLVPPEACRGMFTNFAACCMLCAGGGSPSEGICKGDSGGPLVQDGVLFGITSFGPLYECGNPGYADGYTKVSAYRDWIANQFRSIVYLEFQVFQLQIMNMALDVNKSTGRIQPSEKSAK
jgi:secreted trypsin-like serine protease